MGNSKQDFQGVCRLNIDSDISKEITRPTSFGFNDITFHHSKTYTFLKWREPISSTVNISSFSFSVCVFLFPWGGIYSVSRDIIDIMSKNRHFLVCVFACVCVIH